MYDNMAMGSILVGQAFHIAGCFMVARELKKYESFTCIISFFCQ